MESEEHTMSYDGSGYLKAELAYRAQRISATTHGRRGTVRVPRVRRPADRTR
jgi:YD repeat-containing protein